MARRIEDYALIGDGETCALVARDGSIDWLCLPRFDSDACFAALLGSDEQGRWRIHPTDPDARASRRYRDDTLVLETEFLTASGAIRVIDFMPMRQGGSAALVRLVKGVSGTVACASEMRLRFGYGRVEPWVREAGQSATAVVGPDLVVLRASVDGLRADGSCGFTVRPGETVWFTLQHGASFAPPPDAFDTGRALEGTEKYWRDWVARFDKPTDWPEAVKRSLITLKALVHRPTGGLVAAPTLGLPELPGGAMNWDYRYCWLRDSTFTLVALLNAGYHDDAKAWLAWLLRAVAADPDKMRIMYRVDGSRRLEEWEIGWLPGYEGAQPVRVGNAAAGQRQLDIYGEVLDSLHLATRAGIERSDRSREVGKRLVDYVTQIWQQPDQGMWESRGTPQHYVYSKVMAWVALDRFIECGHAGEASDLHRLRGEMHEEICREGFSARHGSFMQHYGSDQLDASVLLIPLVQFLPATDERMRGTIAAIERGLMEGGLVRRTAAASHDGEEGAFIACSCWMADCMMAQGREADARALFERVLALRNEVGLLSEEYHVPSGRLVGNFPQALSHLALINTALGLCGKVLQRGGG